MTNHHQTASNEDWEVCACCGMTIRLLGDHQSLVFFMNALSAQRRGFQCVNCKQIICYKCSSHGCHCTCRSNAWVALPYLERTEWLSTAGAGNHPLTSADEERVPWLTSTPTSSKV